MTLLSERPATPAAPAPTAGIATQLEALVAPLFGGELPFRLRAWDGSEAGPAGTPVAIPAWRWRTSQVSSTSKATCRRRWNAYGRRSASVA
jgi:hypothetical protein